MCPGRTTQGKAVPHLHTPVAERSGPSGIAVVSAPPTPFFNPAGLAHHSWWKRPSEDMTVSSSRIDRQSVRLTVWTMGNPSGHVGVLGILFSRSESPPMPVGTGRAALHSSFRCRLPFGFGAGTGLPSSPTLILTQTGLLGAVRHFLHSSASLRPQHILIVLRMAGPGLRPVKTLSISPHAIFAFSPALRELIPCHRLLLLLTRCTTATRNTAAANSTETARAHRHPPGRSAPGRLDPLIWLRRGCP